VGVELRTTIGFCTANVNKDVFGRVHRLVVKSVANEMNDPMFVHVVLLLKLTSVVDR
jgi:hypothetical protein